MTILEGIAGAHMHIPALFPLAVPNPGAGTAPPNGDKFVTVMGWVKWVCLGLSVIGIMAVGALMAFTRRGDSGEHLGRLGWAIVGVTITASAFTVVSFLAT